MDFHHISTVLSDGIVLTFDAHHFALDLLAGFKVVFIRQVNIVLSDWPVLSLSADDATFDRPRHSKKPHDRTPTTLGIATMGASSVDRYKNTYACLTVRAPESCNLSNIDQTARRLFGILQRTVHRRRPWQNKQPTITTKPRNITNWPLTCISKLEGL